MTGSRVKHNDTPKKLIQLNKYIYTGFDETTVATTVLGNIMTNPGKTAVLHILFLFIILYINNAVRFALSNLQTNHILLFLKKKNN